MIEYIFHNREGTYKHTSVHCSTIRYTAVARSWPAKCFIARHVTCNRLNCYQLNVTNSASNAKWWSIEEGDLIASQMRVFRNALDTLQGTALRWTKIQITELNCLNFTALYCTVYFLSWCKYPQYVYITFPHPKGMCHGILC